MKKAIFFSLSFLLIANCFAGVVTTKMYLGPKSGSTCSNQKSLCLVVTSNVNDALAIPVSMQLSSDQTTLTITIADSQFPNLPMETQSQLQQSTFIQDAPFNFTPDIFSLLGYSGTSLQIPAKSYPVVHNSNGYVITVDVIQG